MSHTLAASPDGTFIIQTIEGSITGRIATAYAEEAQAFGGSLGIKRFLVDVVRCRNTDSPLGNYDFAYRAMPASNIEKTSRVAVLVSPGDRSHDFMETVARNAGFDIKLFTDRDLAIRYLHEKPV